MSDVNWLMAASRFWGSAGKSGACWLAIAQDKKARTRTEQALDLFQYPSLSIPVTPKKESLAQALRLVFHFIGSNRKTSWCIYVSD